MRYDKLVRDNIPEQIREDGKKAITHIADDREFAKKLEEKLQEEVREFLFARTEEEFADIWEVLDTIIVFRRFDKQRIAEIKEQKAKINGPFSKRIILDEVTE
jgi:predicted house-cleaning noncanonical NTP pyrophosphatase (MazG superfamily)